MSSTARWSTASLGAVVCALIVGILYPRRSLSADEACALLNNATAVELIARRSVAPRVLTPAECAAIVDEAEGRGFAPKRHKLYSTTDVEITSYDRDWQRAGAAAASRLPVAHALLASAVWPRARGALGAPSSDESLTNWPSSSTSLPRASGRDAGAYIATNVDPRVDRWQPATSSWTYNRRRILQCF